MKFGISTFVNDDATCQTCHEAPMKTFEHTKHAKAFTADPSKGNCESCHGPRSAHVEDPTADLKMDPTSSATSGVCLQCHEGASRMAWKAGARSEKNAGLRAPTMARSKRSRHVIPSGRNGSKAKASMGAA